MLIKMKVAGKIRCSTSKQDLESQRNVLIDWAKENNHELVLFEEFAISGRKAIEERESLKYMMERCLSGEFEGLVVVEISRLGRSLKTIYEIVEKLTKANVKIILANSNTSLDYNTLEGRALIGGLALAADIEWMLISERNKRGRERIKKEGIKVGRKRSEEKGISLEAVLLMREKGMSFREIAKELNTSPPTILRMIKRYEDGQKGNVTNSSQNNNVSSVEKEGVTFN